MSFDFLKLLNLDKKWAVFMWLGFGCMITSMFLHAPFLKNSDLFGFGFCLLPIGISIAMAQNTKCWKEQVGLSIYQYSVPVTVHNWKSGLILGAGIILCLVFGFRIVKGLF